MLRAGHLAKVQGLKGEMLLHALMDAPEKLEGLAGLVLAPPDVDLETASTLPSEALPVAVRQFRWHQDRPCVAFEGMPDRTAIEPYKGWTLWMPEASASLDEGESFRHDWIGCEVFVAGALVGDVMRLEPTPGGYDMVVIRDRRPGRRGAREVPYIKAWFTLDLPNRRIDLDPPAGLLDLDRLD